MGVRSGSWASVGSDSGTRCYDCRSIHQATRSVDTMTAKRSKRALLPGVSITLVEGQQAVNDAYFLWLCLGWE